MSRGGAIDLTGLSEEQVSEWLQSFDTVLCDGDGESQGRLRCHRERVHWACECCYGAFTRVVASLKKQSIKYRW